jgi:hypothetical protein
MTTVLRTVNGANENSTVYNAIGTVRADAV